MSKKRVVRNKGRDMIGDYYKTNRKISKEHKEAEEKQGRKPMTRREKIMIIIAVLLVITLIVKSLFLDEVKPTDTDEAVFKEKVEEYIAEDEGIISYRVIEITEDGSKNPVAVLRGYLLWVIPVKSLTVTEDGDGKLHEK